MYGLFRYNNSLSVNDYSPESTSIAFQHPARSSVLKEIPIPSITSGVQPEPNTFQPNDNDGHPNDDDTPFDTNQFFSDQPDAPLAIGGCVIHDQSNSSASSAIGN